MGILASSGSVIKIAQQRSCYQKPTPLNEPPYEPGLFLAEHRRCIPKIISYCNELAYHGRLLPRRQPETIYSWSSMGHFDVTGNSYKVSGSRANREEAQAIVDWLVNNAEEILKAGGDRYNGASLRELVGIVTPFAQQKFLLKKLLAKSGLKIDKVGTVHSLQGAERSVVIFSTVYTAKDQGIYFFDRSVNMLNVAVSRAKDSFLVFGDRHILNPQVASPSGLLSRWVLEEISTDN